MSDAILNQGYSPEEHAPDPVISHGDPTPPGKVGIWLFLASEIMFFLAILGSYIVLRGGSPQLFARHAMALSKAWAGINTLVLIFSSLTMALSVDAAQKRDRKRLWVCLLLTVVCAFAFLGVKAKEYHDKWVHYTIVAADPTFSADKPVFVYDGEREVDNDGAVHLFGYRAPMPEARAGQSVFDIHLVSQYDVRQQAKAHGLPSEAPTEFTIAAKNINTQIQYGPWKNVFFSCYFALTGVHALHVIGGMIPLSILLVQSLRGKFFPAHTEYVGLYWHFVDLVWIFLFPLLYLV